MTTGLFLQREGVLCRRSDAGELELLPGAAAMLARLGISRVPRICIHGGEDPAGDARLQSLLTEAGAGLEAILGAADARLAPPRPGLLLRAAQEQGIDLAASWLVAADAAGVKAAEQAGCLGCVLLGAAPAPSGFVGIHLVRARDLADAPRVMIPPGGGCWHEHRG